MSVGRAHANQRPGFNLQHEWSLGTYWYGPNNNRNKG